MQVPPSHSSRCCCHYFVHFGRCCDAMSVNRFILSGFTKSNVDHRIYDAHTHHRKFIKNECNCTRLRSTNCTRRFVKRKQLYSLYKRFYKSRKKRVALVCNIFFFFPFLLILTVGLTTKLWKFYVSCYEKRALYVHCVQVHTVKFNCMQSNLRLNMSNFKIPG